MIEAIFATFLMIWVIVIAFLLFYYFAEYEGNLSNNTKMFRIILWPVHLIIVLIKEFMVAIKN